MSLIALKCAMDRRKTAPLPYDAEVEYIETDGESYIDTGLKIVKGLGFDTTISDVSTNSWQTNYWFGIGNLWNSPGCMLSVYNNKSGGSSGSYFYFGQRSVGGIQTIKIGSVADFKNKTRIVFSQYEQKVLVGEDEYDVTAQMTSTVGDGYTVRLGSYYNGQSYITVNGGIRFYSVRFFTEDMDTGLRTISLDLVPVRKDGVGYMYDRVSKQLFGNSGTGSFIVGPDK